MRFTKMIKAAFLVFITWTLGFFHSSAFASEIERLSDNKSLEICKQKAIKLTQKVSSESARPVISKQVPAPEKSPFGPTVAFEVGYSIVSHFRIVMFFERESKTCEMLKIEWIGDL